MHRAAAALCSVWLLEAGYGPSAVSRRTVGWMRGDLGDVKALVAQESGLAVAVVYRRDGSAATSVVNAGVLDHPVTREPVVGFVARGHAKKLQHLRSDRRATVVIRVGWEWIAVEGEVDLAGPDDTLAGLSAESLPQLLRAVYAAAVGGAADDWAALDHQMMAEGHTAVLLRPLLIYRSPPGSSG